MREPPAKPIVIRSRSREARPRKGNYVAFMRQDVMANFSAPDDMTVEDENARRKAYSEEWGCPLDDVTICTLAQSYGLHNVLKRKYAAPKEGPAKYAYLVRYKDQTLEKRVYNRALDDSQIEALKWSYEGKNPSFVTVWLLGDD